MGFGPSSSLLTIPATFVGGMYPNTTLQYGLAGTPGSAAELGTLAFVLGNTGAGGNGIAITSETLPSLTFRTLFDNREWSALYFDTFAFNGVIPTSAWEVSAVDVPALSGSVTGATNASPIVIHAVAHGMGAAGVILPVTVASVGGNTAANGFWSVLVIDVDHFSLRGSTGNGSYTSGGTWTTNKTAPALDIIHSSDYKGQTGYGANVIFSHATDGTLAINDRVGNLAIGLNAAGSTLTLGDGTHLTSISAQASISMGNNKIVILDVVGALGATNPKLAISDNSGGVGAGLYFGNANSLGVEVPVVGTKTSAVLFDSDGVSANSTFSGAVNIAGSLNATSSAVISSTGSTSIEMRAGGRPNNTYEWYFNIPIFGFGVDNVWELIQVINGVRTTAIHFDASTNLTLSGNCKVGTGRLNLAGIPTSASGLSSGDVWSNLGILNIVP